MADPNNGSVMSIGDRRFMLGAVGILFLLCFADYFGSLGKVQEASAQKTDSSPKFAKFMGPSIKFLYCYS